MFDYSDLTGCGYCEQKRTQTERVLVFHPITPIGCNTPACVCLPNHVSAHISLFLLIGLNHTKRQNHETLSTQTLSTADIRWMYVLCERECNFILSDKLWQECLVWHCGNTHPVCFGLLPLCVCVNMCVQVETQASKHRLFSHSCVEQQFRGVCVRVCVRVCVMNGCLAQSFLPEARGEPAAAENKKLS